jgi:hypothetical protein
MCQTLVDIVVGVSEIDGFKDSDESDQQSPNKNEGHPLQIERQHLSGPEEEIAGNGTA